MLHCFARRAKQGKRRTFFRALAPVPPYDLAAFQRRRGYCVCQTVSRPSAQISAKLAHAPSQAFEAMLDAERLHIDAANMDLIGRMEGALYTRTRDKFEPNVELAQVLLAKHKG
jgi:hypothetical protein